MASALILAAGFGTRLRPLTLELPKPIVPVGDRPLLAHVAAACRRAGATRLVANVHHEHQKISSVIEELALNIDVVVEPEIRGTAGGVAGARARFTPREPVLVWNGDILTEASCAALLDVARERDAQVLLVSERNGSEGTVGLDEAGCVVRLRGRVFGHEARSADYIGVMALGPSVVAGLPERGCLFGEVGLPHLAEGRRLYTLPHRSPWSDVGDLGEYARANFAWLSAKATAPLLTGDSWVGQGAEVSAGVVLERCLIGAGARITGEGVLSEVIVWPGASLAAPLRRAVALGSGRVVPFDGSAEN
jgi:mannose-1-phosphate guanylyltransferase